MPRRSSSWLAAPAPKRPSPSVQFAGVHLPFTPGPPLPRTLPGSVLPPGPSPMPHPSPPSQASPWNLKLPRDPAFLALPSSPAHSSHRCSFGGRKHPRVLTTPQACPCPQALPCFQSRGKGGGHACLQQDMPSFPPFGPSPEPLPSMVGSSLRISCLLPWLL